MAHVDRSAKPRARAAAAAIGIGTVARHRRVATAALVWPARVLERIESAAAAAPGQTVPLRWWRFAPALAGYAMFGVGYIGYMRFMIALLREHGKGAVHITVFYALPGVAVTGSQALALLSALLGVATLLPALTAAWPLMLLSGVLFGAVFLSLVASTTALVRHSLPASQWAAGISAFTIVFAVGQIAGPMVVGWIADGLGGLARGLVFSAGAVGLGALLAWRQRPLAATLGARTA